MKIEPNKFYKTRCGLKARIYAVDGAGTSFVHGAVFYLDSGWYPQSWQDDGSYSRTRYSNLDLIEEWIEPKPKLKAWVSRLNGDVILRSSADLFDDNLWTRAPWLDEP